jgi:hypothetical protein
MSNKLFLVGLATVVTLATSLVNVVSSQAQVAVGGNTFSTGTNPGGTQSGAASASLATGQQSSSVSSSRSFATPVRGISSTVAGASTDKLTADGTTSSDVAPELFNTRGSAAASASAGNSGVGTTFTNTGANALSIPGFSKATAGGNFGSVGF